MQKNVQMSLLDTYDAVCSALEENKSGLLALLVRYVYFVSPQERH